MPDIKYVCLSDMHFGADNSVLTNLGKGDRRVDPSAPSSTLIELVACLRELVKHNEQGAQPTLVLNGDIFEFALSTDNLAAMAFQRFLELAMPESPENRIFAKEIIYIPGNHDHHLWEVARERQYSHYLSHKPQGVFIEEPWHTTKMIGVDVAPSTFADAVVRRCSWLSDVSVGIVYPNLGLIKNDKLVIFTHGHFTEKIYTLMTTLAETMFPDQVQPKTTYDWEAENFAWIDFFWSTMGRSGPVGPEVELVYETMQSPQKFANFVGHAASSLLGEYGGAVGRHCGSLLAWLVKSMIAGRLERAKPEKVLSDDGEGLRHYLETPVRLQLKQELDGHQMPENVTVVFGHTHKPFEQLMKFDNLSQHYVSVYNSGGWVVDRPQSQPFYGGAVIMLDEDLNAVSLRMYNEAPQAKDFAVSVAAVDDTPSCPNPLLTKIRSLIKPQSSPWSDFSQTAAEAVALHTRKLADLIATS